jgi:hypothetical protein
MYFIIIVILFESCQKADINDKYLKTLDKLLVEKSLITAKKIKLDSLKRMLNESSDPLINYDK